LKYSIVVFTKKPGPTDTYDMPKLFIWFMLFGVTLWANTPIKSVDDLNYMVEDLISFKFDEKALRQFEGMTEVQKTLLRDHVLKLGLQKISGPYLEQVDFLSLLQKLKIPLSNHEAEFEDALKNPDSHDNALIGLAMLKKNPKKIIEEINGDSDSRILSIAVEGLSSLPENQSRPLLEALALDANRSEDLRRAALAKLAESSPPDVKRKLRDLALDPKMPSFLRETVFHSETPIFEASDTGKLNSMLQDPKTPRWVRSDIFRILASQLKEKDRLFETLKKVGVADKLKDEVSSALINVSDPRLLPLARKVLSEKKSAEDDKDWAINVLRNLGTKDDAGLLVQIAEQKENGVGIRKDACPIRTRLREIDDKLKLVAAKLMEEGTFTPEGHEDNTAGYVNSLGILAVLPWIEQRDGKSVKEGIIDPASSMIPEQGLTQHQPPDESVRHLEQVH
jgi:hypothetical protein